MKKTTTLIICWFLAVIVLSSQALVLGDEIVALYNANNDIIEVPIEQVSDYTAVGWFESPIITIYSLDGRTSVIEEKFFEDYHAVGWYRVPIIQIWNIKGETAIIAKSEYETYFSLGWCEEPIILIWDKKGQSYVVRESEKEYYSSKGYLLEAPKVNHSDVILLARVIHAEATQNPKLRVLDRQCVGAVVMNRVRHPRFPNTLQGVIYARNQYTCVGTYWFNLSPPQECIDIATQLLLGETFGVPANVVYQAQFRQGSGVWRTVGVHYYCYI